MTTLEVTQTQLVEDYGKAEARTHRLLEVARGLGSWLVDRFSGSEYPAGRATTVPTFDSARMDVQDHRDWFSNNEYPFGD